MAFNTFNEGLKIASNIGNRAIAAEASLASLSPLASPLPTLHKAFSLYVQAAEAYSHLLQSALVPASERAGVQRKWRLVLERAEKVKKRIEGLGGRVGAASVDEEAEEAAVVRRGAVINGFKAEVWRTPPDYEFTGAAWRDTRQPDLAAEQLALSPEWAPLPDSAWDAPPGMWEVRQGPGADCSVTAGLGACIAHNARWGTKLGESALYPQAVSGRPARSENAKHVVKLLLNGAWRSVVVDALLPRSSAHKPLHITARQGNDHLGPAWIPLAVKGYFKALGGYSIPGSDPAPDVYAFTGWIPERLTLASGFQREKEWSRLQRAWARGSVIVTLGSGHDAAPGLVPLHAYGVTGVDEVDGERVLRIFDPGSCRTPSVDTLADELQEVSVGGERAGSRLAYSFTMSWDEVCSRFHTLNLNWDPALMPITAERHWSWLKPEGDTDESLSLRSSPRYRVTATTSQPDAEVWLLLSQHRNSKDVPLDDIAVHVFRDHRARVRADVSRLVAPTHEEENPYTNALHTLVRYPLREGANVLSALPSRDRGLLQTGFTLRAFAAPGTSLALQRVALSLPFTQEARGALTKRTAGGHPGYPTHSRNPQYRLAVERAGTLRVALKGAAELAWNVKIVWGAERVFELAAEAIVAASGAYNYGMAYCEVDVEAGTYTVLVSSYERDEGAYALTVEASAPVSLTSIPQEGAGMFARAVHGKWDERTAGGRPSGNGYDRNPRIEVTLSTPGTLLARLTLPTPAPVPINLTVFRRGTGTLGEQVATSGPYVERVCGVSTGKVRLTPGIYVLVPSTYNAVLEDWTVDVWADTQFSTEVVQ
ncbi:calpain-like protease palB/RIM13 [Cutaneotrichosporon oleaginosum]|uniref:Calpain-like protease palB/RIM13 n=1 Tax=Cutaneotrichosporon oleaginosum TaxID=879819 RepID=A0A0J1BD59_9TREE|nr:calpain-like protease palB/RIM13 [Cutaneotrichosporon oleaginosum]KLT45989.1 calpain-like protease palB/RIM13 [Cutaneotrichosporon oleaginosum]TXT06683.1 hypothetical protein COLE_06014 [Cutaneotrichosporon oleaginosum]